MNLDSLSFVLFYILYHAELSGENEIVKETETDKEYVDSM